VILCDFNIEQLISIVDQIKIWFGALFSSGLVASEQLYFDLFLSTFCEFAETIQKAAIENPPTGHEMVHDDCPVVDQLWKEIRGVVDVNIVWMIRVLKLLVLKKELGCVNWQWEPIKHKMIYAILLLSFTSHQKGKTGCVFF
jgi:hypothetical protein